MNTVIVYIPHQTLLPLTNATITHTPYFPGLLLGHTDIHIFKLLSCFNLTISYWWTRNLFTHFTEDQNKGKENFVYFSISFFCYP